MEDDAMINSAGVPADFLLPVFKREILIPGQIA